jgi:hypothetical protein
MSGYLLHEGATVLCAHAGQAQPTVTDSRVTFGGQPAVTMSPPYTISGCALPPQAGGPCVTAQWTTGATRVTLGGVPAVLSDSQASCTPTGTPLSVIVTQLRVKGE